MSRRPPGNRSHRGEADVGRRTLHYGQSLHPDDEVAADVDHPSHARTRLGIPVTVLPAGPLSDEPAAPDPSPATGEIIEPPPGFERDDMSVDPGGTIYQAGPEAETRDDRPRSLVLSPRPGGGALQRMMPSARGRRGRPFVPPAEVIAARHTVPPTRDFRLVVLDRKLARQAASIRALRHRIAERGDPRVILVTSAGREEGRTFCAANLALAFAEVHRSRVLLLEADVRGRSLASIFGIQQPPCFLDQLERHKHDLRIPWRAIELSTYDLHLIPVAPVPRSGLLRTMDGPSITACLDSLRGTYEFIIIDGPPVGAGPDIPMMEDAVDGLVFVARADRARAKQLRHALDQVSPEDVLGVALLDM